MRLHCRYITKEIINEYYITDDFFDSKGFIYLKTRKGIYGLKEAAILAYKQLRDHLSKFGYVPMKQTPGLWRHKILPTTFTLAVADFGIKHFKNRMRITSSKPQQKILTDHRLDWHYLPWPYHRLELRCWLRRHFHARLCPQSAHQIQAHSSQMTTVCTPPIDLSCLRTKSPARHQRSVYTSRQKSHTTSSIHRW